MSTPQPPAPSKWAEQLWEKAFDAYCNGNGDKSSHERATNVIAVHHAAAQAETVALLEELANRLKHHAYRLNCSLMGRAYTIRKHDSSELYGLEAKVRHHLTRLKEGAP